MSNLDLTNDQLLNLGISLLIVLATVTFGRRIFNFLLDRVVHRFTGATSTNIDDAIIISLKPPLFWFLFGLSIQIAISRLDFIPESWLQYIYDGYFLFYLFIGFVALWRLVNQLTEWYSNEMAPRTESNLGEQLIPFLRRLALVLIAIFAVIIYLDYFGIEVGGLVATLGIGSLAIALAAQAALSDTISGFIIMIDRPFRIGDRIELLDLDTWGDVIDIGLRSSRIRTRDNRMVIVPNSVIAKSLIVNHSFPDSQYRIQIELGIGYGTDLEKAKKTIIDAVESVEGVLPDRPVEALFLHFGDSAMTIRVRWWLESYIDTRRMFDRVNTAIYYALEKAKIDTPYPIQVIYHNLDDAGAKMISKVLRK